VRDPWPWGKPMRRREFIALLGSGVTGWSLAAWAQQGGRGRRIVALMSMAADDPEAQPRVAAFESGLRELGWLDGRTLQIEYRWVSDGDLLRRNAAELARTPPDLILATSTPVMAALREQGLSVPIMFVQVTDPGRARLGAEPGPSRRSHHRLHQFRVLNRNQVARGAQADRAARYPGRARLQPGDRAARRPVPTAGGGRGSCLRRDANHGRRALRCRARARGRCLRAHADRRAVGAAGRHELDPSRPDHRAGGTPSPAGGLPLSLLCRERRSPVLWQRTGGLVPARGLLCRPYSQRHESGRTARAGADQV